jgi:hypothetical protein
MKKPEKNKLLKSVHETNSSQNLEENVSSNKKMSFCQITRITKLTAVGNGKAVGLPSYLGEDHSSRPAWAKSN